MSPLLALGFVGLVVKLFDDNGSCATCNKVSAALGLSNIGKPAQTTTRTTAAPTPKPQPSIGQKAAAMAESAALSSLIKQAPSLFNSVVGSSSAASAAEQLGYSADQLGSLASEIGAETAAETAAATAAESTATVDAAAESSGSAGPIGIAVVIAVIWASILTGKNPSNMTRCQIRLDALIKGYRAIEDAMANGDKLIRDGHASNQYRLVYVFDPMTRSVINYAAFDDHINDLEQQFSGYGDSFYAVCMSEDSGMTAQQRETLIAYHNQLIPRARAYSAKLPPMNDPITYAQRFIPGAMGFREFDALYGCIVSPWANQCIAA